METGRKRPQKAVGEGQGGRCGGRRGRTMVSWGREEEREGGEDNVEGTGRSAEWEWIDVIGTKERSAFFSHFSR
jgi:hypothetical protein